MLFRSCKSEYFDTSGTGHDGTGKSEESGSAATTAVAYLKKCDNRTDIIIRNKTELQGWQHRGVKGVTNSVIR